MRAILINPETKTVSEVEIDGSLKSLQGAVSGYIELVRLSDDVDLYVNEEGLLHDEIKAKGFFVIRGCGQPLAGCGILLSSGEGQTIGLADKFTVGYVQERVKFYTFKEIRGYL
jgi:hypothetical protein